MRPIMGTARMTKPSMVLLAMNRPLAVYENSIRFASSNAPETSKGNKPAKVKKTPLWDKIKHEVKHYVNGTKLLGYEIKISTKLLIKFVQGYELSRRENNQLKRTMSDVFRLVPFSAFIIVPFAELLLPVALKIFPNLLPSTFESGKEKKQKLTKLNEIRTKTSNFLQETLEESALISYNSLQSAEKKKTFLNFFRKLNSTKDGKENVFTHDEILAVAKMFKNDTVLDNLSRPQLIAMAKYMSIRPFGNDNMLRYQIRYNLKQTMSDDKNIDYEGVESLTDEELYQACVSRGIKTFGVSKEDLLENLKVWLELRLKNHVPSVLMILSSAYTFGKIPQEQKLDAQTTASLEAKVEDTRFNQLLDFYYDAILQVLGSIPDPVYNVAKLDVSAHKEHVSSAALETSQAEATPAQLAQAAISMSAVNANELPTAATTNISEIEPKPKAEETKPAPSSEQVVAQKKETMAEAEVETKKEKAVEEEEEEEVVEEPPSDDNEFKLNVLKEQEELIKKEQEDAKLRAQREVVADDITLDEAEESTEPENSAAEEKSEKQVEANMKDKN